jgi:hypothetical protein
MSAGLAKQNAEAVIRGYKGARHYVLSQQLISHILRWRKALKRDALQLCAHNEALPHPTACIADCLLIDL